MMAMIKDWSPEKRERFRKACQFLRERGYSYEQMPWELCPIPDVPKLEVWEVYALSNPNKTEEQVAAWKARHHPGSE